MQGIYSLFQSFSGLTPFGQTPNRVELDQLFNREDPATLAAYGKRLAANKDRNTADKAA